MQRQLFLVLPLFSIGSDLDLLQLFSFLAFFVAVILSTVTFSLFCRRDSLTGDLQVHCIEQIQFPSSFLLPEVFPAGYVTQRSYDLESEVANQSRSPPLIWQHYIYILDPKHGSVRVIFSRLGDSLAHGLTAFDLLKSHVFSSRRVFFADLGHEFYFHF